MNIVFFYVPVAFLIIYIYKYFFIQIVFFSSLIFFGLHQVIKQKS